jgi:tryptophan synthase alpha chain
MGYANPVEAMGDERFADAAQRAGVDGVLIVDYPPEEAEAIVRLLEARDLDTIFLLSPTTTDARLERVAALGRGYLYYVSLKGVTGAANIDLDEISTRLAHIRKHTQLPVGVGFGIRDADTARRIAGVADAVIIGSRLVQEIETSRPDEINARVTAFMRGIRTAMDSAEAVTP